MVKSFPIRLRMRTPWTALGLGTSKQRLVILTPGAPFRHNRLSKGSKVGKLSEMLKLLDIAVVFAVLCSAFLVCPDFVNCRHVTLHTARTRQFARPIFVAFTSCYTLWPSPNN